MTVQMTLFADAGGQAMPEGFRYRPDLISAQEETLLAAWNSGVPLKPFEFRGYLGNRRVASFGFSYDYVRRRVDPADELPPILDNLRMKVATFAEQEPHDFIRTLVSEYAPGAGIGWHRDKPQFGDVVGVSLISEANFRLRRNDGSHWRRVSKIIAPRSAYLMSGAVRHDWEHSIPEQNALRCSITFRTLPNS